MTSDKDKTSGKPVTSDKIVPVMSADSAWVDVVNQIVDSLATEDLPEKVIEATELMLVGTPNYQIAKKLKVSPQTLRKWLTQYPILAHVVANGRRLLQQWRMGKLEQQFLQAVKVSEDVLSLNLDGTDSKGNDVNPKVLPVIAAQARYIIGLFAGQKVDVTVTHEMGDTVMQAKEDALSYIADQLNKNDQPIEAVYRVVDPKVDNNSPYLDEYGNPFHGEMGKLNVTNEGALCHLCGKRLKSLRRHIENGHGMTTDEYELTYMLDIGSVLETEKHETE